MLLFLRLSYLHCGICRWFSGRCERNKKPEKRQGLGRNSSKHAVDSPNAFIYMVRSLVKDFTEAVKVSNGDGSLPLHFACANTAPLEVVEYLVEQWPEAVKIADKYGWLPFHVTCIIGHRSKLFGTWWSSTQRQSRRRMLKDIFPCISHAPLRHRLKSSGTW
jgi:hypothetical protein